MTKGVFRIIAALCTLVIAFGAMLRGHRAGNFLSTSGFPHVAVHFGIFALLGALIILSFDTPRDRAWAVLAAIALGLATEWYEHLAFPEFKDMLVDALGVTTGSTVVLVKNVVSRLA